MNEKVNGWSNYATWTIYVDILSEMDFSDDDVSECLLRNLVESIVFDNHEIASGSHLVEDYARKFVERVNFIEIAEAINRDLE